MPNQKRLQTIKHGERNNATSLANAPHSERLKADLIRGRRARGVMVHVFEGHVNFVLEAASGLAAFHHFYRVVFVGNGVRVGVFFQTLQISGAQISSLMRAHRGIRRKNEVNTGKKKRSNIEWNLK